ncbi:hypothetical protein SUDANB58_01676 [Streptomyces sp. enrichment culture]|uniref:SCO2400 family protein n=1 Tax=Streptomyces sp. enrichment culture TaxID=1795815 RepID=UPI003F55CB46
MDYCQPCRRHLNGALICPGCGTFADRLPTYAGEPAAHPHGSAERAGTAVAGVEWAEWTEWAESYGDVGERGDHAAPPGLAGAGRRGRGGAAHRRRRHLALFVAAGFALAVGGLSIAALGAEERVGPSRPAIVGDDVLELEKVAPAEVGQSVIPRVGAPLPGGTESAAPGVSPSAAPSQPASASESASASPAGEASPAVAGDTAGTASRPASTAPSPARQDGLLPVPDATWSSAPAAQPTSAAPSPPPAPEPTETCDRFLWWCA